MIPSRLLRPLALGTALAAGTAALPAQSLQESSVLVQPTLSSFSFGSGATKRTVDQTAIPVVLILPFSERFNVDVTTAFASSAVSVGGSEQSSISGLTDTQIRANVRAFSDQLLLTVGLNLPTGQYAVAADQVDAAGQIGNDFLFYPISSMGNGLAATGGIAYAVPAGAWNLGFGGSLRKSTEFDAFAGTTSNFRYQPADEYRARLTADRPVGDGQVSLGLTFSAFGEDVADTTTYSTGDRLIASAGWNFPWRGMDVLLGGWNLFRLKGEQFGGEAPGENIFNVSGALSIPAGRFLLQPNVETRLWQVDGARAGNLVNLGLRARIPVGPVAVQPGVGFSTGNLYSVVDGSSVSISGYQVSLTFRYQ